MILDFRTTSEYVPLIINGIWVTLLFTFFQ